MCRMIFVFVLRSAVRCGIGVSTGHGGEMGGTERGKRSSQRTCSGSHWSMY